MSTLHLSLDRLEGATIQAVHVIPAELARQVDQYLILDCGDFRVLIAGREVPKPRPDGLTALREVEDDTGAFTLKEARALLEGESIGE